MLEYATDVDEGMFDYYYYGHCVFRPSLKWENTPRDDIIDFNEDYDIFEFIKVLILDQWWVKAYKTKSLK